MPGFVLPNFQPSRFRPLSAQVSVPTPDQVLDFSSASSGLYQPFSDLSAYTLDTDGIWGAGYYYYDGVTFNVGATLSIANDGVAASELINTGSVGAYAQLDTGRSTTSLGTPSSAGWYFMVNRLNATTSGKANLRAWRNGTLEELLDDFFKHDLSSIDRLALGHSALDVPGGYLGMPACGFAWGYGDPTAMQAWVYNVGNLRNIADYDFAGDANITLEHHWPCVRVDDSTAFSPTETAVQDTIGSMDSWTTRGTVSWLTRDPPWVFSNPVTVPAVTGPNMASSISHGDVEFTLDTTRQVGNYMDGPAYVVLPSGSMNMSEPTPAQSTISGHLSNGAMFNPLNTDTIAYDARPLAAGAFGAEHDAANAVTSWPQSMSSGDILSKAVSSTDANLDLGNSTSMRRGVVSQYGACFVVSEAPPPNTFAPSVVGWSGRGTPEHHVIDIATKVAALPSYSAFGQSPPSYASLLTRVNKFFPTLAHFGTDPYGHRLYAPKLMGQNSDLYGKYIAGNLHAAMLALISDAYSSDMKKVIATALCSLGNQFFDAYEGASMQQNPNGGLYQFAFPVMALALAWRGDTDKLATLRTTYGGNYRQAFEVSSAQAAQFTRHTSNSEPYTWRERNLDAISGTTFTISTYRIGSSGDNTKGSFKDLLLTNGTASTLVTGQEAGDNIDASTNGSFDIYVTDATGFSVDDTIWFEPYVTTATGKADWIIEGTGVFNQYSPTEAGYRSLNEWTGAVLFLKASGFWNSEWDPVAKYVKSANTGNYPSSDYDWPDHFNTFYNLDETTNSWEAAFYNDHAATILSDVSI